MKVINLGRSKYYVQFEKLGQALAAREHIDGYYINDIKARITVRLCKEDANLTEPPSPPKDLHKCVFEMRIPKTEFFDYKGKIKGVGEYNMTRIVELANRDYFHGELSATYLEERDFAFHEGKNSHDVSRYNCRLYDCEHLD